MNANLHKGEIQFEAGGKPYILQYDYGSLVLVETALNKGIMKVISEIDSWAKDPENMRLGTIRAIFWAGLQKHHPDISIDDATALIGEVENGIGGVVELVGTGFSQAFSAPGTKGTNPQPKDRNGTGTISGSNISASDTIPIPSGQSRREFTRS